MSPEPERQILLWDDDALVREVGRSLIDCGLGDEMSLFAPELASTGVVYGGRVP